MRTIFASAFLLLSCSSLLAQSASPPAPGSVGNVDWIYVPGISSTGTYAIQWGTAAWYPEAYQLEEDTSSGFTNPTQVYQGTGQSHAIGGKANGTYYYRVRGINITFGTQGPWLAADHPHVVDSSVGSVPAAPAAPTGVSVPSTSGSGLIPVTWSAVTGATAYDVQDSSRYGTAGPNPPPSPNMWSAFAFAATDVAQTAFTFTGTDSQEYQFRVRAYVSVGTYKLYSLWSSVSGACAVYLQTPGSPASITVPAASSSGTYSVTWGAAQDAASYELQEDTSGTFASPSTVYQGAALSFQATGKANGSYYYRVRGVNALYQGAYATGANPCVVLLKGTLTLALGSSSTGGTEIPGEQSAPVLQIALSANAAEAITVTSITVTHSGTLTLPAGATGAALYRDMNADGRKDAGDTTLAFLSNPSGAALVFSGFSRTINASSSETWLVTYDLSGAAPLGATFRGSVALATDLTVSGSSTPNPDVAGTPLGGPLKTIRLVGSLSFAAGPGNPSGAVTLTGSLGVPVLELEATANPTEAVSLTSIAVGGQGSGIETTGIAGAFLYLDTDGNHSFNSASDTLLAGPKTFGADDGKVTFIVSRTVPAGGSESYFVVYNFDSSALVGSKFRAGFVADADAACAGVSSGKPVPVSGAPVWGETFTIAAPPPTPKIEGGSCAQGASSAGPGSALGLALLALAAWACMKCARRAFR